MSVVVHLVNGETKTYSQAGTANEQDSLIRVSKWNLKTRKLEDLDVFPAHIVTLAEVFDNRGDLQRIVLGAGQQQP